MSARLLQTSFIDDPFIANVNIIIIINISDVLHGGIYPRIFDLYPPNN